MASAEFLELGGTKRFRSVENMPMNRCRPPGDQKPCIIRSRFRKGRCERDPTGFKKWRSTWFQRGRGGFGVSIGRDAVSAGQGAELRRRGDGKGSGRVSR
jgi:hypothetical protein